jgi:AraC family transcriptional regulator
MNGRVTGLRPSEAGPCAAVSAERRYLSEQFTPGLWLDRKQVTLSSFTALSGSYERTSPVSGGLHTHGVHFFDMRIAPRTPAAHGRLADHFIDHEPLGEVIFVPANHRYEGGGGAGVQRNMFLFLDSVAALDEDGQSLLVPQRPRDCMNLRSARIKLLLTRICRELYEPGFASELMLEGLGTTLLAETLRLLHQKRQSELGRGGLAPAHMRMIREMVLEGDALPSLADIAGACSLSRRHLMRAFRQETGQTVGEFVQQLAMEKARKLLRETNQPVTVVATGVGFASLAAFSTAFRRATGESPRSYRASQRTLSVWQGARRND